MSTAAVREARKEMRARAVARRHQAAVSTTDGPWEAQRGFDELGRPLRDLTFCVVDLETTGNSPDNGGMITEVGAVKVRGGEVLGEFQTLVNPHTGIPPQIAVLTGITNSMVASSPTIESVLPAFLEFAEGCVLVAHNAPFDVGFLKHFAAKQERPWPRFEVLDTVKVARRVITRDETPNHKLGSLARVFGSPTTPDHRALHDARATVDVLHGMMERLGNLGVLTIEDLAAFSAKVTTAQRKKRHLAEDLPHAPGVYLFKDAQDRVLYIGTSKDLRTRVRTYFTASETRSRMGEMVGLAATVQGIECATALEAGVRELRLIAEHKPPYNRRSRRPEKMHFIKLTREPWPRLSLVKRVLDDDADYLGPFGSKKVAEKALQALHDTFPIRQCADRLPLLPTKTPCVLAELHRCLSPCDQSITTETYADLVGRVREALRHRPHEVVDAVTERLTGLAEQERFEEAAVHRDRLTSYLRAAARTQRLTSIARLSDLTAIRREDSGRWAVHVVRHGRLAAAGVIPREANAHAYVADLQLSAETVLDAPGPVPAATAEETELVLRWLESPGVRLAHVEGEWTCPIAGAGRQASHLQVDRLT